MKFPVLEFSSDMFGPWENGKVGHAEVSTMANRHLQQLYDDACNALGFKVRSSKTGKVVTYSLSETVYDQPPEPELLGWEFTPTTESQREVPECIGTKIIVYND